jgi:anti-sigma factor RsiW
MSTDGNAACDCADLLRDYAFDELGAAERKSMEQHLRQCSGCAAELDRLRLTTAALRVLPDVEPPRKIAFVSDKVFEPKQSWLAGFWNSAARLGFASACVLAAGLSFAAMHRPAEVHTSVQTASVSQAEIDATVLKAVALAVDKTHTEDVQLTKAALDEVDRKYAQKQQNLMIAMGASLDLLQKRQQQVARASFVDSPGGFGPVGVTQ